MENENEMAPANVEEQEDQVEDQAAEGVSEEDVSQDWYEEEEESVEIEDLEADSEEDIDDAETEAQTDTEEETEQEAESVVGEDVQVEPVSSNDENFFESVESEHMAVVESVPSANVEIVSESEEAVEELDTVENREVLSRVKRDLEKFYSLYWDLSRDIHHVNKHRLYRLVGYKTFDEYVSKELDFSSRKAYYLCNIYNYYENTLKSRLSDKPELYNEILERVKNIGWAKAEKIANKKVLTSDNALRILDEITKPDDRGRVPTVSQVESIIAREDDSRTEDKHEEDEEEQNQTVVMRFVFSKAQANSVNDALDIAKGICSANSKPPTLMSWVCGEFVETYASDRGKDIDLGTALGRFEELLGMDLVALDRISGDVKYGQETAQALKNMP